MEYIIKLSPDELNVLGAALNELPRKHSQPLFERIQAQVKEQDDARAAEVAAKAKARAAEKDVEPEK